MTYFSNRLTHVLTRADFATLLTPTYAEGNQVDEEEAHDRLTRALQDPALLDALYQGVSAALRDARTARTNEDALMDKLSRRVQERKGRMKPAPSTPKISAVLVRFDLSNGIASETMRAVIESPRGQAALEAGMLDLGKHLVKSLLS